MNVIIGCSSPIDKGSGILTYCKNLIRGLIKGGHKVLFIAPRSMNSSYLEELKVNKFEFDLNAPPADVCKNIVYSMREFEPDLIINNDNCYLQQVAPLFDCRFVVVGHLANYAIGSLLPLNSEYVDEYIAISNDMKFDMVKKYNIAPYKIKVAHNGLISDYSDCVNNTRGKKNNVNRKVKVLFGGENSSRKGADLAISLFKKLDFSKFEVYWTVSNLPNDLESKIIKLGVNITGRLTHEDFKTVLKNTDYLLMPSREEGCPMLLLEAMREGVIPVVSNGTGAMKEIIQHGINGYICDLSDWSNEAYSILNMSIVLNNMNYLKGNSKNTFFQSYANSEFLHAILSSSHRIPSKLEPSNYIDIFDWHRRGREPGTILKSFENRIRYRFGLLKWVKKMSCMEF
jgi:glycosyltransferase involved in cell wall biosynthesis